MYIYATKTQFHWDFIPTNSPHFGGLWESSDYLNNLQQRRKWRSQQPDLQLGILVLLREDNLPPMSWRLGIISETFPSSDGYVRVVTVKTSSGQLK